MTKTQQTGLMVRDAHLRLAGYGGLLTMRVQEKGTFAKVVMPGLVPGIHALTEQARRGWPGQARP